MLVWNQDAGFRGFDHQERLAQRSRPLPQNVIGIHRDYVTQRKYERVYMLDIQIVRRECIGHGVLGKNLGGFYGKST